MFFFLSLNNIKTNLFLCPTLSSLSKIKEINYSLSNTSKNIRKTKRAFKRIKKERKRFFQQAQRKK